MEAHLDTSKTLALVKKKIKKINIYITIKDLWKQRANSKNIKVQYYEMVKFFKIRFSNINSLNNKIWHS